MTAPRKVKAKVTGELKSPSQVESEFLRAGKSISEWAREHGFKPNLVFEVLAGRAKARRGKSHRIAVLLGLKDGEIRP